MDIEDLKKCSTGSCSGSSPACQSCPSRKASPFAKYPAPTLTTSPESVVYDVLIIGAGAIGTSIARELSKYSLRIAVLEKSTDVSQGASKSNSGIVHGGYDEKHGTLKSKLAYKGNQLFPLLNKELNFGFKMVGSLVVGFTKEDLFILKSLYENGKKNGVRDLYLLTREQVLEKEPHISKGVLGALYCPTAGITSPYEYVIALAENSAANGVDFFLNHEVVDIQRSHEDDALHHHDESVDKGDDLRKIHFIVRTGHDGMVYRARTVVNAAGLVADRIASMVGANDFYITPRKGEYLILHRSQGHLARHVLFPVPNPKLGKGILVSPTYHGNLLLGPTSRGADEAHLTQRDVIKFIISASRRTVPDFDITKVITSYSGLRAKCSRGDFIVEEAPRVPGFINAAGIDSPGLTSSPAVAKMVVDLLRKPLFLRGVSLTPNPQFNPYRPSIIMPKDDSFDGAIDDSDPTKNIICRCERVTEAEILDAIHRPLGPTSTDSVKRRTRAGMGPCQGNFCEIRVARLLSRELGVPLDRVPRHSAGSSLLPHRRTTDEDREMLQDLSEGDDVSQGNDWLKSKL